MTDIDLDSKLGNLPNSKPRYVCWFDVMGTASISSRSIPEASVKVFKVHTAAISAHEELPVRYTDDIEMYPMMDGVYAISESKDALRRFLHLLFTAFGEDIIKASETHHILAVRASVAYGPVVAGKDMDGYNDTLEGTIHQEQTLVGLPVIQAFSHEREAPPFGVYIHESARAFAPDGDDPFNFVWWKWFRSNDDQFDEEELAHQVRDKLEEYWEWSKKKQQSY